MKRPSNKILLILSLFLIFLLIGTSSAVDDDSISSDDDDVLTSTGDVTEVEALSTDSATDDSVSAENSTVLGDGAGTFTDLQSLINSGSDQISLDKDYTFNSASDSNLKDGIKITKTITINGNGKTIDGSNSARIFDITGNNVVLNNIIFKNACIKAEINYIDAVDSDNNVSVANGASILWSGANGVLNNSKITGSTIDVNITMRNTHYNNVNYNIANGAGVYWTGNNGIVENTQFIKNTLQANFFRQLNVYDSTTNNINVVIGSGIGLYMGGSNAIIRKSKFDDHAITTTHVTAEGDLSNSNVDLGGSTNRNYIVGRGSALYIAGESGSVEDSTFKNNTGSNAGAIYWEGDNGNSIGNTFTENKANTASAIYWSGSNGNIISSKFNNNEVTSMRIVAVVGDYCKMIDSSFSNNDIGSHQTVWWKGTEGIMRGCNFTNNVAVQSESAMFWEGYGGLIENCNFINNTVGSYGVVTVGGANTRLIGSTFKDNNGGTKGGTVYWTSSASSGTIDDCDFINNNVAGNGGGIYVSANALNIFNSDFTNNKAGNKGDDIYMEGTSSIYQKNNRINPSGISPGIELEGHDFYIAPNGEGTGTLNNPCSFYYAYNRIASGYNIVLTPGVYYDIVRQDIGKSINIIGQNGAIIDLNGTGRAFTIDGANVTVKNIVFKNGNVASNGGAIYWNGNLGTLEGCTFINNTAPGSGGAVYLNGWAKSIKNNIFTDNFADSSNDIYVVTGFDELEGNTFTGSYIKTEEEVLLKYQHNFVKITSGHEDITVTVKLNGKTTNTFVIPSGTIGDVNFTIGDNIVPGDYVLDVYFDSNTNTYTNDEHQFITVIAEQAPIYASQNGGYDGSSYNRPTDLADALNRVKTGGTIILIDGIFTNYNMNVNVEGITIRGSGKTVFDGKTTNKIFTIDADNVVIDSITFTKCYSDTTGGAIRWNGLNGTLSNSKFINCTTAASGGAVYWMGSYATILNTDFISNNATTYGGALVIKNTGKVENCKFNYNIAKENNGGAVRIDGVKVEFTKCSFLNNTAVNAGGGALSFNTHLPTVTGCTFENNVAEEDNGGAIEFRGVLSTVSNSIFINNKAKVSNDVYGKFNMTVTGNDFTGSYINVTNHSSTYTGPYSVKVTASNQDIIGHILVNGLDKGTFIVAANTLGDTYVNLPQLDPGSYNINLRFERGTNTYTNTPAQLFDIVDSVFYISPTGAGTGASADDSCTFDYALEHATVGSVFILLEDTYTDVIKYEVINITGLTIKSQGNVVIDGKNKTDIYIFSVEADNVVIENITITNAYKQAILWSGDNGLLNNCKFINNRALTYSESGVNGVISWTGANGIVNNSLFKNNDGYAVFLQTGATYSGGAIYWSGINGVINNSVFTGNKVSNNGGALYATNNIIVDNCNFTGNYAHLNDGGAVYLTSAGLAKIVNSKFTDNTANSRNGGAIYCSKEGNTIENCIFENNTGIGCNDIYSPSFNNNNNIFKGTYVKVTNEIIILATASNEDIDAVLIIDNNMRIPFTIIANTTGNTYLELPSLDAGAHVFNISFASTTSNTYVNYPLNMVPHVIYASVDGVGTGDSENNPCNWTIAINKAEPFSTIILLTGTYNLQYQTIVSDLTGLTIKGKGKVTLDGSGTDMLTVDANNVVFDNIIFTNSNRPLYWNGNGGMVNNCIFTNNSCNVSGAAIYWYGTEGVINNSVFKNNKAKTHGGAIATRNVVTVENCNFTNNTAGNFGGAHNGKGDFINCNFIDNSAKQGGAVYSDAGNFKDCEFRNNRAALDGGAIRSGTAAINVYDSKFIDNTATTTAGAISINKGLVEGCEFTTNTALVSNDVYRQGDCTIVNNVFTGYYTGLNGEVNTPIFDLGLTSDNFDITVNIYIDGNLYNSTVIKAKTQGNTKFNLTNLLTGYHVANLTFVTLGNNKYTNILNAFTLLPSEFYVSADGKGTGVTINDPCNWTTAISKASSFSTIILLNGTFTDILGQEIPSDLNGLTIVGSGNTVIDGQGLNRIFTVRAIDVTIENITFKNAKGPSEGGTLLLAAQGAVVRNCTFINSTLSSGNIGAAIDILEGSSGLFTIDNCVFINNTRTKNRGVVSVWNSAAQVSIINSVFINNNAAIEFYSTHKNSVVRNCTFVTSTDIINGQNKEFTVEYNRFIANQRILNDGNLNLKCQYNWYGINDPTGLKETVPYLNVNYKVLMNESLVSGEYNPIIYAYFVTSDTGEVIDPSVFNVPVNFTINTGNGTVIDAIVGKSLKISPIGGDLNISFKVDEHYLCELVFGVSNTHFFSDLQKLIDAAIDGDTLSINNDYTYNPDTDGSIVVDKPVTLNANGHTVSGNNGIDNIFNITSYDVDLENINIEGAKESAIISSGDDTNITNATIKDVKGTAIQINGRNAGIKNLTIADSEGVAINITGSGARVKGVDLTEFDGTGIDAIGNDIIIEDLIVKGGSGTAINVEGKNADVSAVNLTEFDGTGINANGKFAEISDVNVNGGNGTAIKMNGLGGSASNINLTNYDGTGVKASGIGVSVDNVVAKDSNGTAVDVTGYAFVSDVDVINQIGTGVRVNGSGSSVDDVLFDRGEGKAIVIVGDETSVNNVTANDFKGIVVDVTGDNATVGDVNLDNVIGTGVKINGTNNTVVDVDAKNSDDIIAIDILGNDNYATDVDLDNVNGTGVRVNGTDNVVYDVDAKNTDDIVAVDVLGDENTVATVKLDNVNNSTGVRVNGTDNFIYDVGLKKSDETIAVDILGNKNTIGDVNLDNTDDSTGVRVNGTDNIIDGVDTKNGENVTAVEIIGDNNTIDNIDTADSNATIIIDGNGTTVGNITGDPTIVISNGSTLSPKMDITVPTSVHNDESFNITISVDDDHNGFIIVSIPGIFNETFSCENGTVIIPMKAISAAGIYNVTVSYVPGNASMYSNSTKSKDFTVKNWNFTELQAAIDEAISKGEKLTLEHDYVCEPGEEPIKINDAVVIDGNGHIIDANNNTCAFNITAGGVELDNMTIVNVNNGTVIDATGNDIKLSDITLTNNTGTGINVVGNNSDIENVIGNNHIGDLINVDGDNNNITGTNVNYGNGTGIKVKGDNNTVTNTAGSDHDGPLVAIDGDDNVINNTIAEGGSGAVVDISNGTNNTIDGITRIEHEDPSYINQGTNTTLIDADKPNVPNNSLSRLQKEINKAAAEGKTTFDLGRDYVFAPGDVPITIPEGMTINGNGHTIDGNGSQGIFNITNDNVTLNNMTIKNVNGTAINAEADNFKADGINLTNNTGIGIHVVGNNSDIENVIGTNHAGDLIKVEGENATVNEVGVIGGNGTGVEITGDGAKVSNVDLDNHIGEGVIINGNNATIAAINSFNATSPTLTVTGNNSNISAIALVNQTGQGIIVNGDNNTINGTTVNGGNGTAAVNVNGNNNTVEDTVGNDHIGTLVAINGNDNAINNSTANGGNGTIVDIIKGNNNTIDGINSLGNHTGDSLNDNGTNTTTKNISPGSADKVFDLSKANADPAVFTINLPKDATGNFTISIGGKNYTASVVNGTATVTVKGLSAGPKDVLLTYTGDKKYGPIYKTATINVPTPKPTIEDTVLVAKKKITFKKNKRNKNKKFAVTLTTKAGKVLAGQKVYFKLDKKILKKIKAKGKGKKAKKAKKLLKNLKKGKYAVTTKANGKATLKLKKSMFKFKKGKGKLTASFQGDSNYKASSAVMKIVMK